MSSLWDEKKGIHKYIKLVTELKEKYETTYECGFIKTCTRGRHKVFAHPPSLLHLQ